MIEEGPFEGIEKYELEQEGVNPPNRYVNHNKLKLEQLARESNIKAKSISRILKDLREVIEFS